MTTSAPGTPPGASLPTTGRYLAPDAQPPAAGYLDPTAAPARPGPTADGSLADAGAHRAGHGENPLHPGDRPRRQHRRPGSRSARRRSRAVPRDRRRRRRRTVTRCWSRRAGAGRIRDRVVGRDLRRSGQRHALRRRRALRVQHRLTRRGETHHEVVYVIRTESSRMSSFSSAGTVKRR